MPALFVIHEGNLFRHLLNYGSQRKVSVSIPACRESKPDLTFKTPTCTYRGTSFISTRQGGLTIFAEAVLHLIFSVLTLKFFLAWIKIYIAKKYHNLEENAPKLSIFRQILFLPKDYTWVVAIDTNMSCVFTMPPYLKPFCLD